MPVARSEEFQAATQGDDCDGAPLRPLRVTQGRRYPEQEFKGPAPPESKGPRGAE
jgi:hypothetical protein